MLKKPDLSGRQQVCEGEVQIGDIIMYYDGTWYDVTSTGLVGAKIKEGQIYGLPHVRAVYRVIPVPHQADAHLRGDNASNGDNGETTSRQVYIPSSDGKAKTYDDGKPPLAYLPWAGIDEVAQVQAYGHKKYGDFWNYRQGMEVGRNLSCAIRHIRAYMEGEDNDPESQRNHLAHACCRLLFTLQNLKDGTAIDDRYKPCPKN